MMKGKGWESSYTGRVGLGSAQTIKAPIKSDKARGGKVRKGTDLRSGK